MAELFDSLTGRIHFPYICAVFNCSCRRRGAVSDGMSGDFLQSVLLDKVVKFRDPRLNHSREILPEAGGNGIFDGFFRENFRPEVISDGITGVTVD